MARVTILAPAQPLVAHAPADAFRPDLRAPLTQTWLASLWMGLLCNWPLWLKLQGLEDVSGGRGMLFTVVFAGVVVAGTGALLSLLAWPRLSRAVLGFLLLASGALAYFIGSYGIVFDPGMVVNALQTDVRETRDLLSWRLAVSLLLLGAPPAWWLWRQPAAPAVQPLRRLLHNLRAFGLGLLALVLLILGCLPTSRPPTATIRSCATWSRRSMPCTPSVPWPSSARLHQGPAGRDRR